MTDLQPYALTILLAPLLGALASGLGGKWIGKRGTNAVTISLVALSFIFALFVAKEILWNHAPTLIMPLYTWASAAQFTFKIGLLIDPLSAMMMLVVTFVSLCVHIYSIGYMKEDPGYSRFFSYVSLFTFAMLSLVMADNFVLLFFGWEGVGLVSYLLIGFWFERETAAFGGLKAFLVNRVGDLGLVLGVAAIFTYFDSLDYMTVFQHIPQVASQKMLFLHSPISVISFICIALLIGASGKSAQVPLHVWLPESMEGPTPISALIHAATMVTAGVFMVCRLSPLFELSPVAMSTLLVLGGTTCLFMGILGVVQHDIKRVIAYSTLSQLGYMMIGVGSSAFAAGLFHLFTHACFKALLFLAAGSVIIGMHHEQDMRKMGGLARYMPITYVMYLIGALSLSAIPPFSGFFSKDVIIMAVHKAAIPGASYAYACALIGAFLTALYIFRSFFLTFHGKERFDENVRAHLQESPAVVWSPLVVLAIPSIILGGLTIQTLVFNHPNAFGSSLKVLAKYNVLNEVHFTSATGMVLHAFFSLPFWFALLGVGTAWWCFVKKPSVAEAIKTRFSWIYAILVKKYGFDDFNQIVFARGSFHLGNLFFRIGDLKIVDGWLVNGSGRLVKVMSRVLRHIQTGYLTQYTLVMVLGLVIFLCWF